MASAPAWPRTASQRIVAIGDLHGDYAAFEDIAQAAGVIDAKGNWAGGDAVLVQLGDIADRGPDSLKIYRALQELEKDAPKKPAAKMVVLVGNHEAMNVTGDLRYVSAGEYDAFKDRFSKDRRDKLFELNKASIVAFYRRSQPDLPEREAKDKWFETEPLGKYEHRVAWSPQGEIGKWIAAKPAMVKLRCTIFVHGGLSVETAARPMDAVNAEVDAELAKGESKEPSILTDPLGPLWYRGNIMRGGEGADEAAPADPNRISIADELTQVLAAYHGNRLVVAHTPNPKGIVASEDGRLVRIDTGNSFVYGGVHSYLEITGDAAIAHRKGKTGHGQAWNCPRRRGLRLILAGGLAALALASGSPALAQGKVTPLFASDTPIDITITGPIRELVKKSQREIEPYPATLATGGETLPIQLSVRGHSRLASAASAASRRCASPSPGNRPTARCSTGRSDLKLVVHCQDSPKYEQYVLREYSAYRLYNVLTPESFRVRLVQASYQDEGKQVAQRWAYFIEDASDLAKRLDRKQVEVPTMLPCRRARSARRRARLAVRIYDRQPRLGHQSQLRRHRLLPQFPPDRRRPRSRAARSRRCRTISTIPASSTRPMRSRRRASRSAPVRNRYYRGLCRHNEAVQQAAGEFLAARSKLEAELRAIPQLDPKERDDMIKYMGGFFDEIATPRRSRNSSASAAEGCLSIL